MEAVCMQCGEHYSHKRKTLGYVTCLKCGDAYARTKRHCIVPLHKSNYIFVSPGDFQSLAGINNKGGIIK